MVEGVKLVPVEHCAEIVIFHHEDRVFVHQHRQSLQQKIKELGLTKRFTLSE